VAHIVNAVAANQVGAAAALQAVAAPGAVEGLVAPVVPVAPIDAGAPADADAPGTTAANDIGLELRKIIDKSYLPLYETQVRKWHKDFNGGKEVTGGQAKLNQWRKDKVDEIFRNIKDKTGAFTNVDTTLNKARAQANWQVRLASTVLGL
jgi:hypothetical protein